MSKVAPRAHRIVLALCLLGIGGMPFACSVRAADGVREKNRYSPYPPVRNVGEGISWPEGQALAVFATPAETVDAARRQGMGSSSSAWFADGRPNSHARAERSQDLAGQRQASQLEGPRLATWLALGRAAG